jgi:hypothetical protein
MGIGSSLRKEREMPGVSLPFVKTKGRVGPSSGLGHSASVPPVPTAFGSGSGGTALQRALRSGLTPGRGLFAGLSRLAVAIGEKAVREEIQMPRQSPSFTNME